MHQSYVKNYKSQVTTTNTTPRVTYQCSSEEAVGSEDEITAIPSFCAKNETPQKTLNEK